MTALGAHLGIGRDAGGRRATRRVAGGIACCTLALALAGCFGSSSSSSNLPGADPASVLPASTLVYLQAVVRPTGSLSSGIDAASERLLGIADPGAQLDAAIDKAAPSSLSYEKDIRPWLGARAAFALLSASGGGGGGQTEYAIVFDQTNTAKAQAFVASKASYANKTGPADTTTSGTYKGVKYTDDTSSNEIVGVVGQFLVIANDTAAFDAIVDVQQGASSLASLGSYQQAVAGELSGAAGMAYLPIAKLLGLIESSASGSGLSPATTKELAPLLGGIGKEIYYGSARFDSQGALLDVGVLNEPSSTASASSGETNPIAALPADSWLAAGATNVGPALLSGFDDLTKLAGATGTNLSQSLAELQLATGLDIRSDLDSITTLGLFVQGTSRASLQAALLLGVKDPSQAARIVGQLQRLGALLAGSSKSFTITPLTMTGVDSAFTISVPSVPYKFVVAAAGGRIIVALDQSSLSTAIAGGATLGSTSGYTSSAALLGSAVQPDVYLDLAQLTQLLKSAGIANSGTSAGVLGYLERLGSLALGSGKVAGVEHERIAITGS